MGPAIGRRLRPAAAGLLAIAVTGCAGGTPASAPIVSASPATATAPVRPPTPPVASPAGPAPTVPVPATPAAAPTPSPSAATPSRPDRTPRPDRTATAARPLPACRYADQPARGDPERDWATMVVDTILRLPEDFVPSRLVSTTKAGMEAGYEVRPEVVDDLEALHRASKADGAEVAVRWAYRSYREQEGVFNMWARESSRKEALRISARPGHSEHQLGTALDFRSADDTTPPWLFEDWGTTKPGAWMRRHSWEYGFVMSYPEGLEDESCYSYEPWHFRYVGREIAAAIHASGHSPRRYLWEHAAELQP